MEVLFPRPQSCLLNISQLPLAVLHTHSALLFSGPDNSSMACLWFTQNTPRDGWLPILSIHNQFPSLTGVFSCIPIPNILSDIIRRGKDKLFSNSQSQNFALQGSSMTKARAPVLNLTNSVRLNHLEFVNARPAPHT